jgi:hypothetical protein
LLLQAHVACGCNLIDGCSLCCFLSDTSYDTAQYDVGATGKDGECIDECDFGVFIQGSAFSNCRNNAMGNYVKTSQVIKNRPVYKRESGGNFLFQVTNNNGWVVGPTPGENSGVLFVESNADIPSQISETWRCYASGERVG